MSEITDSEFYMWRTVFALAYADDMMTKEEVTFTAEILEDIPFSDEQAAILRDDIRHPKNVMEMFERITNQRDQAEFFEYARKLVWVDGDYGNAEQDVMLKLISEHIRTVNVDELVGNVELELEDDPSEMFVVPKTRKRPTGTANSALVSFRERFLQRRFGENR